MNTVIKTLQARTILKELNTTEQSLSPKTSSQTATSCIQRLIQRFEAFLSIHVQLNLHNSTDCQNLSDIAIQFELKGGRAKISPLFKQKGLSVTVSVCANHAAHN